MFGNQPGHSQEIRLALPVGARRHHISEHGEAASSRRGGYIVVPFVERTFGVEVVVPDTHPTDINGFVTGAEAEAWIAGYKKEMEHNPPISTGPNQGAIRRNPSSVVLVMKGGLGQRLARSPSVAGSGFVAAGSAATDRIVSTCSVCKTLVAAGDLLPPLTDQSVQCNPLRRQRVRHGLRPLLRQQHFGRRGRRRCR